MFLGNIIYDLHRFRDTYLSSLFFLKQNLIYCQNCFFLRQKSKGQKQFCNSANKGDLWRVSLARLRDFDTNTFGLFTFFVKFEF